jgi:membrane-bound lytic murein transglycosylase B
MAPIDDALAALKLQEPGERLSYKACAAKSGVDRHTLSQRYRGVQGPVEAQTINKQKLNPQQEQEFVAYMKDPTDKALPPTR